MLNKQILREYGLYADLVLPGGAKEVQPYQLGLATDTKQLIHRIGATYYHNLSTTEATPTAGSLCVIGADGYNVLVGAEVGVYNSGAGTLTLNATLIGTEDSFWPDDKYAYFGNTIASPEAQIGYDEAVSDEFLIQTNTGSMRLKAHNAGDITLETDSGSIILDTTDNGYEITLNPSQKNVDTIISSADREFMAMVDAENNRLGIGTGTPVSLMEMLSDTAPDGAVETALTITRDSGAIGTAGTGVGVTARLRDGVGPGGTVWEVGDIEWAWANAATRYSGVALTALDGGTKVTPIYAYCSPGGRFVDIEARHDVITSGGQSRSAVTGYYDSADTRAKLVLSGARGTEGAPAALQANDIVGGVYVQGYHGGSAFDADRALIEVVATEAWTSANRGYALDFYTRDNGSNGDPTLRGRIDENGYYAIGHGAPETIFDIREEQATGVTTLKHVNTATAHSDNRVRFVHSLYNDGSVSSPGIVNAFLVTTSLDTITEDAEDAKVTFQVINDGSTIEYLRLNEGGVVVNEGGNSLVAFRVEGGSNPNLLRTDPVNNRIAVGHSAPDTIIDIREEKSAGATTIKHVNVASANVSNRANLSHFLYNDGSLTSPDIVESFYISTRLATLTEDSEDAVVQFVGRIGGDFKEYIRLSGEYREVVVNEAANIIDFRVEGAGLTHLLFCDASTNRVGIKTSAPNENVTIYEADDPAKFELWSTRDGTSSHGVIVARAAKGGAAGSESALTDGTTIFSLAACGYGATGYDTASRGAITINASEDWTDADMGFEVRFFSRENGTAAESTQRAVITNDGRFAVGTDSPDTLVEFFDVTSSSGAVVPVLKVTRDDGGNYANDDGVSVQFAVPNNGGTERILGEEQFYWEAAAPEMSSYKLRLMSGGSQYNAMTYVTEGGTKRTLSIPADQINVGRGGPLDTVTDPHIFRIAVENSDNDYNWKNLLTLRTTTSNGSNGDVGLGGGIVWELEDEYASVNAAGRIICEYGPDDTGEAYLRFFGYDAGAETEFAQIGYDQIALRAGDISGTNVVDIDEDGVLSFTGDAEFHPVRVSQASQPTPSVGEMLVWRDSANNKTYIVYNDTDEGVNKVEMI